MPVQKYRVDTDKGSYIVEVEVPDEPKAELSADQKLRAARPAGFDVDTAGDINPLNIGASAAFQGFKEGTVQGAKGFAKGVIPGAVGAVTSIPAGIVGLVKAFGASVGGAARLMTDPVGTLSEAAGSVASMGPKAVEMFDQAMQLARSDPEGFGKAVGEITGAAEVGILGARALPMAPKPVLNRVGKLAESVGTHGKWPIRMMGAHQLGSGNPAGLVTMMAPEMLKSSGTAMQRAVTPAGAGLKTTEGQLLKLQNELSTGARAPEALLADVDEMAASVGERLGVAKLPSEVTALQKEQSAITKLQNAITRKVEVPATDTRLPSGAREIDAGNVQSPNIRIAPDKGLPSSERVPVVGTPVDAPAIAEKQFAQDIENSMDESLSSAKAIRDLKSLDKAIAVEQKSAGNIRIASGKREAAMKAAEDAADLAQMDTTAKAAADATAKTQIETTKKGLVAGTPRITETVKAPGQSMTTTFGPPPASGLTPFEEELLARASSVRPANGPKVTTQPASAPAAPSSVLDDIPQTLSRNPLSSLDDRLTDHDVQSLKDIVAADPSISVEEATAEMLRQRAQRSSTYRSEAGLSRLEQSALDRDLP